MHMSQVDAGGQGLLMTELESRRYVRARFVPGLGNQPRNSLLQDVLLGGERGGAADAGAGAAGAEGRSRSVRDRQVQMMGYTPYSGPGHHLADPDPEPCEV